jgi:NodT family efflux transporter outer membrane factor (OMF) lipoprotein
MSELPVMPSKRSLLALAALALLTAAGCSTIPEPATPRVTPPAAWAADVPAGASGLVPDGSPWWQSFENPELTALIDRALLENSDLRLASARVAQARALTDGAEGDVRPHLGAEASALNGRDTLADPRGGLLRGGFRASWEPDLFGRGKLALIAASKDAEAAELDRKAARTGVAAEVATAYFEAASLTLRRQVAQDAVATLQRQVEVAQRRFELGQSTQVDIDRLQGTLGLERANVIDLARARRVRLRQLAVLLGATQDVEPPTFLGVGTTPIPVPAPLLPADLLERRPDVQRQSRAVDAAAARLGIARRDLYPRIEFDWAGSRQSLRAEGQGATYGFAVGYGVSLSLPILDGGRIRANIAVQEAGAQAAMADYEKAMLGALADAEIALHEHAAAIASEKELAQALDASSKAAQRTNALFGAGLVGIEAVLDTNRSHLQTQDAWLRAREADWVSAVAVRRAFAGSV